MTTNYADRDVTFHRWSETGYNCYVSGQDCSTCPLYEIGLMHKLSGYAKYKCNQPKANQYLIDSGIEPPEAWRPTTSWRKKITQ